MLNWLLLFAPVAIALEHLAPERALFLGLEFFFAPSAPSGAGG